LKIKLLGMFPFLSLFPPIAPFLAKFFPPLAFSPNLSFPPRISDLHPPRFLARLSLPLPPLALPYALCQSGALFCLYDSPPFFPFFFFFLSFYSGVAPPLPLVPSFNPESFSFFSSPISPSGALQSRACYVSFSLVDASGIYLFFFCARPRLILLPLGPLDREQPRLFLAGLLPLEPFISRNFFPRQETLFFSLFSWASYFSGSFYPCFFPATQGSHSFPLLRTFSTGIGTSGALFSPPPDFAAEVYPYSLLPPEWTRRSLPPEEA